jgi:hypothetical protein
MVIVEEMGREGKGEGEKSYKVWGLWDNKALMCIKVYSSVVVKEGTIVRRVLFQKDRKDKSSVLSWYNRQLNEWLW